MVVLLAGSIEVDLETSQLSAEGVNATLRKPLRRRELFGVILGLLRRHDASDTQSDQTSIATAETPKLSCHVLIAEDNSINQMYVVEMMKQLGGTCDTVADGRAAVAAVQKHRYDVVLMDCQMPEMDGFEATRRIRQLERDGALGGHLPIVALTAYAIKGDRERCLDAGMDDYLSKPLQKQELARALEQFVRDIQAPPGETESQVDPTQRVEEPAERAPIDAESLLARCFGNLEFAGSLLDELASTGIERVEAIRQSASQQNAVAAADAAHALKGAAGILCAETVQQLAAEIEQAGRASAIESIQELVDQLAAEMRRCLDYVPKLRQDLNRMKEGA